MPRMVVGFASLLHLVLCANAIVRCARERWALGVLGGIARLCLIVVVGLGAFAALLSVSGAWTGLGVAVAAIAGPVITFTVIALAWRRSHLVPAAQEEQAERPLRAWVPVGVVDAIFVVIQLGAWLISRES
jgi:hypothetical protein